MMQPIPIIAGNWKMYKTAEEAVAYIKEFIPLVAKSPCRIFLAAPFTALSAAAFAAKNTNITIGAQNMSDHAEGAFTGEVSSRMLLAAGAKFVILGHSERRQYFHEKNAFICRKIKRALLEGITPILCIGESQEERDHGKTQEVLRCQLKECLEGISGNELLKIAIAYEPIWAIGTGKTATPEIAEETHAQCREFLSQIDRRENALKIPILYGGSVKPEGIKALMHKPNINGVLVGGASLEPKTFAQIVNYNISAS